MKNILNKTSRLLLKPLVFVLAIFSFVGFSVADEIVKRDPTITCEGVPRWDRFVVNNHDTKWDPANGGCYFIPGQNAPAPKPVDPKLYGKYGDDSNFVAKNETDPRVFYGKYNESSDFVKKHDMYGKYETETPKKTVAKATVTHMTSAPKKTTPKPIVAKKAASPVEKNSVKTKTAKPVPKSAPVIKPAPVYVVAPKPEARNIAKATKGFNMDDYCTDYNLPVKGQLPDGLVLMSGAPDKMCCVIK